MDVAALIIARANRAGAKAPATLVASLARYLDLLARWNRRMNLTALTVDPPDEAAIDRLIVEPLIASRLLEPADRFVVDVGSGSGSPGIPMKLAAPHIRFVLVEVKHRKSAFLREAVRQLAMRETDVRTARVEDLVAPLSRRDAADVATLRAVRLDDEMVAAIRRQLRPHGRLLWFRSGGPEDGPVPRGLTIVGEHAGVPGTSSRVVIATIA